MSVIDFLQNKDGSPMNASKRPILASERVRHVGDPVVFIIAETTNEALDAAKSIANENNIIVAVTGKTDYVTDGNTTYAITGGHEIMTKVTATGCALSCLIGAAIAVGEDKLLSTASIISIYGLAGEMLSLIHI